MAAKMTLAAVPLKAFLNEALIPYERDEVTRLIVDDHDAGAFAEISHRTVGDFRNWLLSPVAGRRSPVAGRRSPTARRWSASRRVLRPKWWRRSRS
ncbi:MAG: hypothetical protein GAK33_07539 [Burkholderia lata]|uniref:Ethanolamine ammonia lyase large subunit n=1 Tax=Burkholderia lata (strain ATCC 17760 / DSM 23089 / LMG 22485 / NCIMB 9086 / R18194 / 383) TaxID=482957 RepID=A0A833PJV8_BURL3|nr:MAG: hypothetical protein GAK33_07539 [Burkholderia lata]